MRFLKNMLLISSAAVMLVPAFSCGKHEKLKEDDEIESELEEKYGRDFELVSHEEQDDLDTLRFRDDNGLEFTVSCARSYNIVADSRVEYSDDYIRCYLKDHSEEYFSGIKSAGITAETDEKGWITFCVDSYQELDDLYEEAKKLDPPLIYPEDNYISSSKPGIKSSLSGESVGMMGSGKNEEETRYTYVTSVRNGSIKETLPEEVYRKYPARVMTVVVNGKTIKDLKAYVQEATGDTCIEFSGVYQQSQNYIAYYEGLEEFIKAVVGKEVKKVYDPNVVYENKNGSQTLKKQAENYFEWAGGKFDLYSDEAVDITNSKLRLKEDDIKRIFGAEWTADPIFTGTVTIETH